MNTLTKQLFRPLYKSYNNRLFPLKEVNTLLINKIYNNRSFSYNCSNIIVINPNIIAINPNIQYPLFTCTKQSECLCLKNNLMQPTITNQNNNIIIDKKIANNTETEHINVNYLDIVPILLSCMGICAIIYVILDDINERQTRYIGYQN